MKSCDQYLNAINELVDGTLGPLRRAELDMHVEGCDRCRAVVADLRQMTETARALEPLPPPDGAWAKVAERLRQEGRVAERPSWSAGTRYRVLALAAALVLVAGASALLLWRSGPVAPEPGQAVVQPAAAADPDDPVQGVASELALTETHFQNAIERATQSDALVTPETAAVLQKNLLVVNQAIAESRAALNADPASAPARQSLYDALRQKIQFLQDTIALMNVMRQGDAAGAAELIDAGKS